MTRAYLLTMLPGMSRFYPGSFRLFRLWGIDVSLHWTWLLIALLVFHSRRDVYSSQVWNVLEYLSLFAIVLMHEFGHALATRSVGGIAEHIQLWPLGGVAYVNPPQRPGAVLWSIAAGPLVNVLLMPVTFALLFLVPKGTDQYQFLWTLSAINIILLVFNLLPVYPLDGGQILRALLWFFIGPIRSLKIAASIGMIGAVGLCAFALLAGRDIWLLMIGLFIGLQAWSGLQQAKALAEQWQQQPPKPTEPMPPRYTPPPFP